MSVILPKHEDTDIFIDSNYVRQIILSIPTKPIYIQSFGNIDLLLSFASYPYPKHFPPHSIHTNIYSKKKVAPSNISIDDNITILITVNVG